MAELKIEKVEFHSSRSDWKKIPQNPSMPQFAFCGRSNAGKSSLINAILDRKELARVSATPGKTQLINFFLLNDRFFLVDLPGFGYAKVNNSKRDEMIEMVNGYLNFAETLKVLFILCDAARPLPEEELNMVGTCFEKDIIPVLVRTKVDKLNQKEKASLKKDSASIKALYPDMHIILSSVNTGAGISEIRKLLGKI